MNINTILTQSEYLAMSSVLSEPATINGTAANIIVGSTKPNDHADTKTIRTLTPLTCGDLITYKDKPWLVISEVAGDRHTIYRGLMRVCPFLVNIKTGTEQVLKGYDEIGRPVYETQSTYTALPAIIDSRTFGIDQGQINIATGQLLITLQENETSLLVGLNDRFTKFNSAWIVSGIDRTRKGLITLTVDKTESSPSDPPDPDAPDVVAPIITLNGLASVEIELNETYIDAGATAIDDIDGQVTVTDDSATAVDTTREGVYTVTYTAQDAAGNIATATRTVVVAAPPAVTTITAVTGANDLLNGNTATYTATVTINGVPDTTVPVVWSLFADDQASTTMAAEFSPAPTTAQTCTLKGKTNTVTYVQLKCSLQSDPTTFAWKRIRSKSLM